MTNVNVERLQWVLDYVTSHPDEWDQDVWGERSSCGTRFCVAGHVVNASPSYQLLWFKNDSTGRLGTDYVVPTPYDGPIVFDVTNRGQVFDVPGLRSISDVANELLGLNYHHDALFAGEHSLHDLWYVGNKLAGGRLRVPANYQGTPHTDDDDD